MAGDIELLPVEPEDLDWLRELRNDPVMNSQLLSPSIPISRHQQELWYKCQLADKTSIIFIAGIVIVGTANSVPIGYGQLKHIDYINRSVELGCHIEPHSQGMGYGSEVVIKLIKFAFTALGLHRIYLEVFAKNEKAIHVYEKCGFKYEGTQIDKVFKNGRFEDVLLMSIINA